MNLHDKLEIEHCWTTPIGKIHIYLPDEIRQTLIGILTKRVNNSTSESYDQINKVIDVMPLIYNLFDYSEENQTKNYKVGLDINKDEIKCLKEFEKISSKIIRTYINKAWDFDEDVEIKVRCFGNVQRSFSKRTTPHFHHGWDGVFIHYLTVGEEFNYPLFDDEANEKLATTANRATLGRKRLDTNDVAATPSDHSGELLLLDPRPAIRMPYNDKAKVIKPTLGLTLIHPAYLWHETQTHTKAGIRVAIVINFNIENRNYDILPTSLI